MGLERAGAAFAVFKDGKLVCDLYGGTANETNGQKWTKKSMSVLFSTTKVNIVDAEIWETYKAVHNYF